MNTYENVLGDFGLYMFNLLNVIKYMHNLVFLYLGY